MRNRLIDLIEGSRYWGSGTSAEIADHLLAEGVIVPPCKAGDVVFQTDGVRIYPLVIEKVIYDTNGIAFDERAIGRSIFLTRDEAKKALAERSENGKS